MIWGTNRFRIYVKGKARPPFSNGGITRNRAFLALSPMGAEGVSGIGNHRRSLENPTFIMASVISLFFIMAVHTPSLRRFSALSRVMP